MEKGESPLDEIIQDLVARAFQAEAVEQKFFSMFGVSSADEWNRKYMGIGLFDGVNLQNRDIRNKAFQSAKGFNIYNKTILTLNTQSFAHSILEFNSNITRDSKALNEIMRKSMLRVAEMGLEKVRQNIFKGDSFKSLGTKMVTEGGFVAGLQGKLGRGNVIFNMGIGAHLAGKGLEQDALEKMGREEALKYLRDNKEDIRKQMDDAIKSQYDKGASTFQQQIRRQATKELSETYFVPEDFGLPEGVDPKTFQTVKEEYIKSIATKLSVSIPKKMKSHSIISISGALGEAIVVTILEEALKDIYGTIALVIDKARDQVTKKRTGESFDSFVDLTIKDPKGWDIFYNIQVKNTIQKTVFRDTGLAVQGGNLHFTAPTNFSSLIDDIASRGILNAGGTAALPYQIVNHYYRYQHGVGKEDFFKQLAVFFATTIEHFLRSATVEPITRAQDGATAIENHFILRPSMGIVGISTFLKGVAGILISARNQKKIGAIMPIVTELKKDKGDEGQAKDPEQFHKKKLAIARKYDSDHGLGPGEGSYPPPLLQFGTEVGKKLYESIPAPNIWVSVEYIAQQIYDLGQGGEQ